tara:strand:- start:201 stop:719 length:519 start_codon:yes stop_codon:yes gene_type:complete
MSQENQVASETVSEQTTQETPTTSPDVGVLIAESKKYRARAQDAEARISEMEKKMAEAEEAKLKEKEDFKALYEKVSSENQSLSSVAEKWTKYENTKRASLLEKHPEEERDSLSNLDLETLEYVTGKINNIKPNAPQVLGQTKQPKLEKSFSEMTDAEKSANWKGILKAYKK